MPVTVQIDGAMREYLWPTYTDCGLHAYFAHPCYARQWRVPCSDHYLKCFYTEFTSGILNDHLTHWTVHTNNKVSGPNTSECWMYSQ